MPLTGEESLPRHEIVSYLDNDDLSRPPVGNAHIYAVDSKHAPLTREGVLQKHPLVFGDGVGLLDGEYHIRINAGVDPVQHAPRRVPVAVREQLQSTLEELVLQDIIAPVTQPTPWISSLVVLPKKNGRLRLCLDPQDLNKAIQREHYPLPTIEEIGTRLHGAKLFTTLDVRHGFWHIALDEESSLLTTFNTPLGGIAGRGCPLVSILLQKYSNEELVEDLEGVEVVADDFVVVGFGESQEEASKSHDAHLSVFLKRCEERNLKLNEEKLKLRLTEVPLIGHVATAKSLRVDPHKVQAIQEMPPPTDVAGVQRLLGLAQYLSKFLPHLADLTKPLRELTHQDSLWIWDHPQQAAFHPILRYYNLKEEVTLQCDASQSGLSAALLQGGQPVAYASRALTPTETRYAQIEKELLAIVFACDHFEAYVYGRECVHIETDHQPLVSIVTKPLNKAPSRLQRMLLRLQKYSLKITYKKGSEMYLADTLSRAHRSDVSVCAFTHQLEETDHTALLAIPPDQLERIKQASADDLVLTELRSTIRAGWPEHKSQVSESVVAYYDVRDELTVQDSLVFKGPLIVIPNTLRKEMIELVHSTHIGTEGCLRRARDIMYWPRMSMQLKDYVSKCDVCMAHRPQQSKEPIQQHEFAARPWSRVGADLCELKGRTLLVVSDYYSNYIEVEKISNPTTLGITKALMVMFARYGVPDTLVSDNGPQFSSEEFRRFATRWGFEHITSSPHYPQSNGKAENAKTAFATPFGLYQFNVMPFGLQGAPATFQRLMDKVIGGLEDFAAAYLDDLVVFSETWEEHVAHLRVVFDRIKQAGLTVKARKCQFATAECQYLGHVVGSGTVRPEPSKVRAVELFEIPRTKKQVRVFLGLTGYYRRFIQDYASIAAPLSDLTRKSAPTQVVWSAECDRAFRQLKEKLCASPVLRSPDFEKEFVLQTDASDRGIGAVLSQLDEDGHDHPVAFFSRKLLPREERYSTVEKECLAIKLRVQAFKVYLLGKPFCVQTDHRALVWLDKLKDKNSRLTRWSLALQPFQFSVSSCRACQRECRCPVSRSKLICCWGRREKCDRLDFGL